MQSLNSDFANVRALTRRQFLHRTGLSLGGIALSGMLAGERTRAAAVAPTAARGRAKSIIYLHMSGAPPSLDLFDWKPKLVEMNMQPCPDELIKGQRFAFIKGVPKMLGTPHKFKQHG